MKIGKKEFELGKHTYVMGIINVTPDSFSDGGSYCSLEAVIDKAEQMVKDGVDIIDIGGESTRPGSELVSAEEEKKRVIPVVFALSQMFDIPISIDTYKEEVARAALEAGASLVNDVYGLRDYNGHKNHMAELIAEKGCACCLMQGCDLYNERNGELSSSNEDVIAGLKESLRIAEAAGIKKEQIILDPGVGFGKTYEGNLEVLRNLSDLKINDYALLLGTSRKSVIGITLGLPVGERLEGTLATTAIAVNAGYDFVRVHDVKENVRFIQMYEKMVR